MLKRLLAVLLLTGFGASLVGCNTVEGVGKDVKAGGAKVQEEAREHKTY